MDIFLQVFTLVFSRNKSNSKPRWWFQQLFSEFSPRKIGEDEPHFDIQYIFFNLGWLVESTHQKIAGEITNGCFLQWWYPHFTPQVLIIFSRRKPPWVCWGNPTILGVAPKSTTTEQRSNNQKIPTWPMSIGSNALLQDPRCQSAGEFPETYGFGCFQKNMWVFPPKSSHGLIGFSMIFTIHFGVPLFLETPHFFGKSNGVTESGYRCLDSVRFQ